MKEQPRFTLDFKTNFNQFINPPEVVCETLSGDEQIPNNQKLPLLLYPNALDTSNGNLVSICQSLFITNGWQGSWQNGIFSYDHYHSMAHEVLGICVGKAKVQFGGKKGIILPIASGDVVIIPAGVGHKNLGASPDLCVVGAYPPNQTPDICDDKTMAKPDSRLKIIRNIAQTNLPLTDPVYGTNGPLLKYWQDSKKHTI